ncbi:hypothetical protein [Rummeliibacillus stabekisii]|uniref:hypothetical protein n=1 Tax=Rummeliibacillus stabekisii TaxID=241244 RepID=UPI001171BD9E|nr:hypothetical protein [Rummeliibacillus stabekisii]MBB5170713.1 hypothetical protein [Rummeliibacillus stabekisii]GEL06207.1 hypothetical protein RST01_28340 [Rummeliibacillus stabekisii]
MDRDMAKQMGTEIVLDVAVTQATDALKEHGLNVIGEILTDTVASAIPALGGQ